MKKDLSSLDLKTRPGKPDPKPDPTRMGRVGLEESLPMGRVGLLKGNPAGLLGTQPGRVLPGNRPGSTRLDYPYGLPDGLTIYSNNTINIRNYLTINSSF